jgi:cysteinyl-tRNA synthetase
MAREYLGYTFDMHLGGEDLVFPHHENEIAQTESLTHKPMARYWVHVRFLLVEGEKMSKKLGNFYTLRDLMLMGHKASSIRFLLAAVPFTKQLNFTFDGLKQAAQSVERLRNLKSRLEAAKLPAGSNPKLQEAAATARKQMTEGLADDMNTAVAMAAIFDLVRETNIAADNGELRQGDVAPLQTALKQFDEIFDLLRDDDAEKTRFALEWGKQMGRLTPEQLAALDHQLSDAQVEALITERNEAKRARDFARADAIRKQLTDAGVLLEDTKDGVRWKRK